MLRKSTNWSLKKHVQFVVTSSLLLLFVGAIYAKYYRYSLFRPLWYVAGSEIAPELIKDSRAREYLASFKTSESLFTSEEEKASICVVIPSASREKEYVFRSVASIALSTKQAPWHRIRGTVIETGANALCARLRKFSTNTNFNCVTRLEAAESSPSASLKDAIQRTTQSKPDEIYNWLYRERYDYALAVDWCTRHNQDDYILVMQDDGIMSSDGLTKALIAARELDDKHRNWMVLRLYSSDFWSGWEKEDTAHLLMFAIVGALLTSFAVTRNWNETLRQRLNVHSSWVRKWALCCAPKIQVLYFFYGFIWFLLGPLIIGKQHLPFLGTRTSGGVVPVDMTAPGTVGYLYSRPFARSLVQKLITIINKDQVPVDLFVNELIPKGYGYELLPNVVDHVGFVSSSTAKERSKAQNYIHPHHVMSGSFYRSAGSPF